MKIRIEMMDPSIITPIATGIFSVAITLITSWFKSHLDYKRSEKKRGQDEQLTESYVDSIVELQEYLDTLREKWGFDRAAIYQFHNGGKFFNGISMKKYSLTFESTSPGIARVKEISQNVFVSEHPSLMKHMNTKDFFCVNVDDKALDYMRDKIENLGILQIITVPMRTLSGSLLGFIQFSTIKNTIKITEDAQKELIEAAQKISGHLHI